jgi:hypothetical protein
MSYLVKTTMIIMAFCFSPRINFGQNMDSNYKAVALFSDPRIHIVSSFSETKKQHNPIANNSKIQVGSIRSTKGYRVIIYSGIDRSKANNTKVDFMRRNPGVRVYMTYSLPQYKIKVGNFSTRKDADELYRQLSGLYSPCMVVPDIVEINTFRKND